MNKIKLLVKLVLSETIFILASTFVLATFSYFNILNEKIINIIQILLIFMTILFFSYKHGKTAIKHGYLAGIKIGGIFSIIYIALNLFFCRLFNFKNYIYYILILITSMLGGMIGISKKE